MKKDAEAHKAEDEKRKAEADNRNEAEQLVFQTEKTLKDLGDKVSGSEKEEIEALIKDTKDALDKNDFDLIKEKKEKLSEKAQALATKVYEEAAKANSQTQNEEKPKDENNDNVKEAEYEEK